MVLLRSPFGEKRGNLESIFPALTVLRALLPLVLLTLLPAQRSIKMLLPAVGGFLNSQPRPTFVFVLSVQHSAEQESSKGELL